MVDLYGLYIAVVFFLWRLIIRPRVVPLLFGTSYSLVASCVTRKKNFTQALFLDVYSRSRSTDYANEVIFSLIAILHFVRQNRFVGRRRLESPSLLCFMNRLTG